MAHILGKSINFLNESQFLGKYLNTIKGKSLPKILRPCSQSENHGQVHEKSNIHFRGKLW